MCMHACGFKHKAHLWKSETACWSQFFVSLHCVFQRLNASSQACKASTSPTEIPQYLLVGCQLLFILFPRDTSYPSRWDGMSRYIGAKGVNRKGGRRTNESYSCIQQKMFVC